MAYVQVFTTVDDGEKAQHLAQGLVQARLAACVQVVGPIHSTYWWQGQVESSTEFLLLIKTRSDLFPQLEAWIKEHHPYQVPELLAVPVTQAGRAYLAWMERVLAPGQAQG